MPNGRRSGVGAARVADNDGSVLWFFALRLKIQE